MQDLINRLAPYAPWFAGLGGLLAIIGVWGIASRRKD